MSNRLWKAMLVVVLVVSFAGCGIRPRVYSKQQERVDQEIGGNYGFSDKNPKPPAPKKTRQVFVLELVKDKPQEKQVSVSSEEGVEPVAEEISSADSSEATDGDVAADSTTNFADNESNTSVAPAETSEAAPAGNLPTEYTVKKDDTMQKIAKKFYGSFNK